MYVCMYGLKAYLYLMTPQQRGRSPEVIKGFLTPSGSNIQHKSRHSERFTGEQNIYDMIIKNMFLYPIFLFFLKIYEVRIKKIYTRNF